MALKTFNVDEKIYETFSEHCKKEGISMSKQVEKFIISEVEKIKNGRRGSKKEEIEIKKTIEVIDKDAGMRKYC